MQLPLGKRLRKRQHVEIAMLQDELVEILYSVGDSWVFHGGTAVWRCYGGNRFSENLDFYGQKCLQPIPIGCVQHHGADGRQDHAPAYGHKRLGTAFRDKVAGRGLEVTKFKQTDNLLFAKIAAAGVEARVEVNFSAAKKGSVVMPFEKTDGSFMDVLVLPPELLLLEKLEAYRNRRFIRDIYDVYHLGSFVRDDAVVCGQVAALLDGLPAPVDEKNLKSIVYSGVVPSFAQIACALGRRWK